MKNYVIYITVSIQIKTQSHYSTPQLLKLKRLTVAGSRTFAAATGETQAPSSFYLNPPDRLGVGAKEKFSVNWV